MKFSLLVHRGRNAEGVGLSNTMGAGSYRRRDLLKLSKNVLFDQDSFEDLKKFSAVQEEETGFHSIERRRQLQNRLKTKVDPVTGDNPELKETKFQFNPISPKGEKQ